MSKIICRVAMFRFGVNRFEKDVNCHLANGWSLMSLSVEKKGLKIICLAELYKDVDEECE